MLDSNINSITEFKQIIGRGTRVREDYGKLFFTIIDFRGVTELFADPAFDGDPVVIYLLKGDDPITPPDDGGGHGGGTDGGEDGETTIVDIWDPPVGPERRLVEHHANTTSPVCR